MSQEHYIIQYSTTAQTILHELHVTASSVQEATRLGQQTLNRSLPHELAIIHTTLQTSNLAASTLTLLKGIRS